MLVFGAVLFVGLMIMAVLAVDFSRVVAQRNEIHTAADAGALAGAVQFLETPTTSEAVDTAIAYAQKNMIAGTPTPTAELGYWNDSSRTFTATTIGPNAVRVQTQRSTNYLIGNLFSILPATMRRTSVAWASAPVGAAPCVRPWALPYDSLLAKLGISNPNHVLTQDDLHDLLTLSVASRRITLKYGANNNGPPNPGNFNAVVVPSFWQASSGTYRSPRPLGGASRYEDRISTESCPDLVAIGDSIETEPGNMPGPTVDGADELCARYGSISGNSCGDGGAPIKVVLYGADRVNGREPLAVRAIAGFVLETIERGGGPNKGEISGYFTALTSGGMVGGANTTLVRPILVQ